MKFLFAFAVLFIGAVSAQAAVDYNRVLAETLEQRASALLAQVQELAKTNREQHAHLLQGVDRQIVLIEALALDLKTQLADPNFVHQLHHIHVIEEELLQLENRVAEEIAIVTHVQAGNDQRGESTAELITRGQQLIKDAQAAIAAHPQAREIKEIQSELIIVESLVKAIQAKPAPTAADLLKDEQELARHERALRQLIDRANRRG